MSDFAGPPDCRLVDAGGERTGADDEAFADIWQRYSQKIYQRCLAWMGGHRADAEEAFSRAGILIFRKFPAHYPQLADPRAWLLRLAYNACMDLHRENSRRREADLEPNSILTQGTAPSFASTPTRDPERTYLQKELQEFLLCSIDDLPSRLRETVFGYLALANNREVADRLAITEVSVRKRMQEARAILKHRLQDYRSGSVELNPRPINGKRRSNGVYEADDSWRVHALRPMEIRLPSEVETEAVLLLVYPPNRASRRRKAALERYIFQHPKGWKKRFELGRHLREEGKLEEAISHLEHVVQRQPRQFEAWLELVASHHLLERPADVVAVCERALTAVSGTAAPELLRGLMERCRGREEEAERAFDAAREAAPRSSLPSVSQAEMRLVTGRPVEAAEALDAALAIDPNDAAALTFGHEALRLAGRHGEAERRAAQALLIDGSNPLALVRWLATKCRATHGHFAPGTAERRRFKNLQRLATTRADARRTLAFFHACRGDLAGAEQLLAALVHERPRLRQAWVEYARFLDWCGRREQAVKVIDEARALQPRDRQLELQACRLFARAGLARRVHDQIQSILERFGEAWDVASTAAWALARLGLEPGRAVRLSRAAVERQPRLPAAWIEHGQVLARCDRLREAKEALETGHEMLPQVDDVALATPTALALAVVYRQLGHHETCRLWARRALAGAATYRALDPLLAWIWSVRATEAMGVSAPPASHRALTNLGPAPGPATLRQREEVMDMSTQLSEVPWWR